MIQDIGQYWELLKSALALEFQTTAGRINVFFGVLSAAAVGLFLAGRGIESLGNFFLRLFKRPVGRGGPRDSLIALESVLIYFVVSVILVVVWG